MKKIFNVILSILLVLCVTVSPLTASAIVTTYGGTFAILPGNTRTSTPVYNYGWLDNVIIRDDAMAVTSTKLVPEPQDYKGSHTCDEFVKEVDQYSVLFKLDEDTITAAYDEITKAMYYIVTAMGLTDEYAVMRAYIEKYGIRVGGNEGAQEKMEVAVVYAALKYNAVYTLYNKQVSFPVGTSLEGAMVIIFAALTGTMLPSGINTIEGFAFLAVKNYVQGFEEIPLSENPSEFEVFHWVKALTASAQDYQVPVVAYDAATVAQKQYVDYAYYASILDTIYDVHVNPIYLVLAIQSGEEYALQRFILTSMLNEKGVVYDEKATIDELFNLAVDNGWFMLEDEFYSDVMNYKIEVAPSCEKLWFTPFVLAGQLDGGDDKHVEIVLNDTKVAPSSTTSVALDSTKSEETIRMIVYYNDNVSRQEHATYEFRVVKNSALAAKDETVAQNDMVAQVEQYVKNIIPVENESVTQVVEEVFSKMDSVVSATNGTQDVLTTYGIDENTTYALTETPDIVQSTDASDTQGTSERFDFDYLEDLINGVYATDENGNIVTTASLTVKNTQTTNQENVIDKAVEAVKENPEIVVAPSSLVAVGTLAGYLMSKKHRGNEIIDQEDEYASDDDE